MASTMSRALSAVFSAIMQLSSRRTAQPTTAPTRLSGSRPVFASWKGERSQNLRDGIGIHRHDQEAGNNGITDQVGRFTFHGVDVDEQTRGIIFP